MSQQSSLVTYFAPKSSSCDKRSNKCLPNLPSLPVDDEQPKAKLKKLKMNSDQNQLMIDAGQKQFGSINCNICGMIYDPTFGPDVSAHTIYHDKIVKNFTIFLPKSAMKSCKLLQELADGKVFEFDLKSRCSRARKVVEELIMISNRELRSILPIISKASDFDDVLADVNQRLYIFVSEKFCRASLVKLRILGCLFAVPIRRSYKFSIEKRSTTDKGNPAEMGVERLWVSPDFRMKSIATKLMDGARCNFLYGYVVSKDRCAFSDPTADGVKFACKYFRTTEFPVYFSETSNLDE